MATEIRSLGGNCYTLELEVARAFLVVGDERALLIDAGGNECDIMALIRSVTDLPCDLFFTHGDGDHTANHRQFPQAYCHEDEIPVLRGGHANISIPLVAVPDGHVFDLGNMRIEVLHTPGHTPGHCCLLNRDGRWLISGDSISYETVFLFGPTRDLPVYRDSLDEVAKLRDEFSLIFPCHGPCPLPVTALDDLRTCVDEALAGNLEGQAAELPFPVEEPVLKYQYDPCSIFTTERKLHNGTEI